MIYIRSIFVFSFLFFSNIPSNSDEYAILDKSLTVSGRIVNYKLKFPEGYEVSDKNPINNLLAMGISKNGISDGAIAVFVVPQNEKIEEKLFIEYFSSLKDSELPAKDADIISRNFVKISNKFVYSLKNIGKNGQNNIIGFTNIVLNNGLLSRVDCFSTKSKNIDITYKTCYDFIDRMTFTN